MLEENLKKILSEIEKGNNLGEKITLVGATKTVDVETINKAVDSGLKVVAENKVQEFREKTENVKGEQQFIGHLQTNKIKYLIGKVSLIQSVDSIHLAEEIDKCALKKGVVQDILLEVNIGGELSKSGFTPDNVLTEIEKVGGLKNVKVVGLMAMLPKSDDEKYLSTLCNKMRTLYDTLKRSGKPFKYLSMGMTNDYKIAINNGSNMIRIGSGIFGKRNYEVQNGNI